ncbi:MAG: hypothetical protein H0X25_08505 [Acidobacteriales bacterium]|nr:hypothetical protein [Terriglobales bacterium]
MLDLNHDGTTDFLLLDGQYCASGGTGSCRQSVFYDFIAISPIRNPNRIAVGSSSQFAAPLLKGSTVGPNSPFPVHLLQPYLSNNDLGPWIDHPNAYLGLKFNISGVVHYGWARISLSAPNKGVLKGYAYETQPNKPIVTGQTSGRDQASEQEQVQPGVLGALAQGSR